MEKVGRIEPFGATESKLPTAINSFSSSETALNEPMLGNGSAGEEIVNSTLQNETVNNTTSETLPVSPSTP